MVAVVRAYIQGLAFLLIIPVLGPSGPLLAQEYDAFEDYSQRRVEQFIGRAERLSEEQAWSNYVELGIATERIAWESEAYEQLQRKIEDIEETQNDEETRDAEIASAEADFEDARQVWETGATEFLNQERGRFLAREEALDVARQAAHSFEILIATAEAEAAREALLETGGTEEAFAGVATSRERLNNFDRDLNTELARARATAAGLTGIERQNFDEELAEIENGIRREFAVRRSYFLSSDDSRAGALVALPRADDLNEELAPAAESASTSREELVEQAREAVQDDTAEQLKQARSQFDRELSSATADALDPEELAERWEQRRQEIIAGADKAWAAAGADFRDRRTAWLRDRGTPESSERQAWSDNLRAFDEARQVWREETDTEFATARKAWERRLEELRGEEEERR